MGPFLKCRVHSVLFLSNFERKEREKNPKNQVSLFFLLSAVLSPIPPSGKCISSLLVSLLREHQNALE